MIALKEPIEHRIVDHIAMNDDPRMHGAPPLNHSPSNPAGCDDRTMDEHVVFVMRVSNCGERQVKALTLPMLD
jgi:hypothetical protein